MKIIRLAFNVLLITLVQTMLCPYIKIGNIMPDLLFINVLFFSQKEKNPVNVMCMAAASGVVMDCLTGRIFGNYASIYLVAAVAVCFVKEAVFKNSLPINIITAFIISILAKSLFYVINISVLKEAGYLYSFAGIILPEAFYNTIIYSIALLFSKIHARGRAGENR